MDDQKNRPGQNFGDDSNRDNNSQQPNESGSSYYYSYGPFQSYGKDNEEGNRIPSSDRSTEDVEITPPPSVRPLSSPYALHANADQGNGNGSSGQGNNKGNGNWQYNKKPKSSVKSVIAGALAGMLILTGAMVFSDRENLFTPDQAAVSSVPASTQINDSEKTNQSSKTSQAVLPITNANDVSNVVDLAGKAVVKIETLVKSSKQSQSTNNSTDPFNQFFFGGDDSSTYGNGSGGQNNQGNSGSGSSGSSDQLVPTGLGSGFVFDKTGYILTNEHVVHNADVVQVTVQGTNKPYEAKVLGTSYDLDLAVLKIEGSNFPSISLGSSDNTKVGQWLVAIGNPQGFDHSVTAGVLSSKGREITIAGENGEKDRKYENLLQTDASINPGNSGGPLLNLNGEVIGINVAVSENSQGIGFAIPTSTIKEVLEKLKKNEAIPQKAVPFIGASLMTLTDEVAKQMGTNVKEGSVVSEIVFKSPAYKADLRPYDIITGADGKDYATKEDLIAYIQTHKVGDAVKLNVVRNDSKIEVSVTIGNKNDFKSVQ
ncbi:S1-C subfamily serine protease [Paenibacillus shirakamiensis]|uniref:S1-C subfamily serine protease n=1 Tax=Paenibacillus shirakamiensis TaxID=1265935 RepID=A0ABS4JKG0_9BACL|nr:trypsin-like peptidase domain-containing protein [Paenibacillus shirakamiensis]MBP2002190.1 S1-C subfamily serine protease [Paenibacillus shirakamiensis]